MARTAMIPRPVVIQLPRRGGGRIRRAARRAGGFARRRVHHVKRAVPTVAMALGGAAAGFAMQKGEFDKLPQIGGSRAITMALVGWGATRFIRNSTVRTAGLALLTAAAFDWGRVQGGGASGLDENDPGTY